MSGHMKITEFFEEQVKRALFCDELTHEAKRKLINYATYDFHSNYHSPQDEVDSEFDKRFNNHLAWVRLIGGKQNYEKRRQLVWKCSRIFRLHDARTAIKEEMNKYLNETTGTENDTWWRTEHIVKKIMNNEQLDEFNNVFFKKLDKQQQYKINAEEREGEWKKHVISEEVMDRD